MRSRLADVAGALVVLSVAFGVLLASGFVRTPLLLRGYLLAAAALALLAALAVVRAAAPAARRSRFEAVLRQARPDGQRLPQLERVERAVTLAVGNAFELHVRLRPRLQEIAELRLARRGVALDSPAGRAALGEEAWALLRPDLQPPEDRFASGITPERLRRVVETLEAL